jgi:hypothetical protein
MPSIPNGGNAAPPLTAPAGRSAAKYRFAKRKRHQHDGFSLPYFVVMRGDDGTAQPIPSLAMRPEQWLADLRVECASSQCVDTPV